MMTKRSSLLLLGVLVLLVGCKATTTGSTGPDAVYLAPEYPTLKLESLAYLGMAAVVQDLDACSIADALMVSYLKGGQQKLLIVDESTTRSRAISEDVQEKMDSLIRGWKDEHTIDKVKMKALGTKLGFDGFVFADLTQWREETVDWTSEGNSFTEVGLSLAIYDAESGRLAWQGDKMERRESMHYRHGQGVGSGVYAEGTAERTERADKIVPPPPPAKEVAESVVQNLLLGLPDRPSGKP